jgi:hypothetical protein
VRSHGTHLILFREEALHSNAPPIPVERVRMSSIGGGQYSLSARDWRGMRWEPMSLTGSLEELLELLEGMEYLIAPMAPPNRQAGV